MGLRFIAFATLVATFSFPVCAVASDIRVRLFQEKAAVTLSGEDIRLQSNPPVRLPAGQPIEIEFVSAQVFKVNAQVHRGATLSLTGRDLKIGTEEVPDHLKFHSGANGFDVVTELPFEKYLLDVVASEIPSTWPLETLKAQAVAARTYAEYLRKDRAGGNFDLDSTTQDQVFHYKRHLKVPNSSGVIAAVEVTERQVLVDTQNNVIKSFFHGHCGGETEDRGAVWPEYPRDPNFKRMKDSDSCAATGGWTTQITKQQVLDQFGASDIVSISARLNKDSARVDNVELKFIRAGQVVIEILKSQDFRRIFGYTKVRSTIFTIQQSGDAFDLAGRGYGHGVGMCQTGSRWMGASGSSYDQILSRYYTDTKIATIP